MAKHPAAFINAIAEEGTKAEAIKYLQETWDDYMDAKIRIRELEDKYGKALDRLYEEGVNFSCE